MKLIQLEQEGTLITFSAKNVDYGYIKLAIERFGIVDETKTTTEMYLTVDNYNLLTKFFKEDENES